MNIRRFFPLIIFLVIPLLSLGAMHIGVASEEGDSSVDSVLVEKAEAILGAAVEHMAAVLFYPIFGLPFLVLWLIIGGVFFTLRLGFVNIRLFRHAIAVVAGKYDKESDPGEVSHLAALSAAVSATVGLGNIAGVAIAVTIGGPGAVIWMAAAGLLGMSTKFAEVTMGHKYRHFDKEGKVAGGAFYYLSQGLAEKGLPRLGKVLAVIFAVLCIAGSLGGGNMFQANQTVAILTDTFDFLSGLDWVIAIVIATSVGMVLIGGIRRIAKVAEAIVPTMAVVYLTGCVAVLVAHNGQVLDAIALMFNDAISGGAVAGGLVGALVAGFKRAAFSNEAGVGSAPIAHAAAKTTEPVREGTVALLEPFIDTVVICFFTGLVITVTGVYNNGSEASGALLTSQAFVTVADWFPVVLSVAIVMFAFSTMMTWSYYGERCWGYLFGYRRVGIFHIIFCTSTFIGGVINLGIVIELSDLLLLAMALPNLIGLYILSPDIKRELNHYIKRLKAGEFQNTASSDEGEAVYENSPS